MHRLFTAPEAWLGGFYELAIELSTKAVADCARTAQAIWSHPSLDGCYARQDVEPTQQERQQPEVVGTRCFGVATLPNGKRAACGTVTVRESMGPDWLCFYLPMESLGGAYNVGAYPFGDYDKAALWRPQVDDWLAQLGRRAFAELPFALGILGHEASGQHYAREIFVSGVPVPSTAFAFLVPKRGQLQFTQAASPQDDA